MTEENKENQKEEKKEEQEKQEEEKKEQDQKEQEQKEEKEQKTESAEESKEKEEKEEEKEVEVPEKFKKIVEEIESMSVLDLAELVKILEKKFGVSAAAPVMMAGQVAGGAGQAQGGEAAEEKSTFNIELKEVGDKKIEVIKVVRDIMQKGLKEAKDLVDAVASGPQMIKEGVKKEEAEEIKKKFEAAGAKVELK